MRPDDFWELTLEEWEIISRGYWIRLERQWEHTRWLGSLIIKATTGEEISLTELVPLSFDKKSAKQVKEVALMSAERFRELAQKWSEGNELKQTCSPNRGGDIGL